MSRKKPTSNSDHDILAEKERIANRTKSNRIFGGGLYDEEIGSDRPAMSRKGGKSSDHDILAEKERLANRTNTCRSYGGGLRGEEMGNDRPAVPQRADNSSSTILEEFISVAKDDDNDCIDHKNDSNDDAARHYSDMDQRESYDMRLKAKMEENDLMISHANMDQKESYDMRLQAKMEENERMINNANTDQKDSYDTRLQAKMEENERMISHSHTEQKDSYDMRLKTKMEENERMTRLSNADENKSSASTHYLLRGNEEKMKIADGKNKINRNARELNSYKSESSTSSGLSFFSLARPPSLVPLARQRVRQLPTNLNLLEPTNRLMKVKPEQGEQRPGAYAYQQTGGDSGEIVPQYNDENEETPEFHDESPSDTLTTQQSGRIDMTLSQPDSTSDRESPSLPLADATIAASQSKDSSTDNKFCNRERLYVRILIHLVASILIAVGVIIVLSIRKKDKKNDNILPENIHIPASPPCNFTAQVLNVCQRNQSSFLDLPECVEDRYKELMGILNTSLQEDGVLIPQNTCHNNNVALLNLAFNTKNTSDSAFLRNWFGLTAFYLSTESSQNGALPNWLNCIDDPCKWITSEICNDKGNIGFLYLPKKKLTGTLPENLFKLFPSVELVDLSSNEFKGTVPVAYANLHGLMLETNQLTGVFPSKLLKSKVLKSLSIGYNKFNKIGNELPNSFKHNSWQSIGLDMISFENMGIPSYIFNQTKLQRLTLEGAKLSGTIPSEIGLLTELSQLKLNRNRFDGTIPTELGKLRKNLNNLDLEFNGFRGVIPSEIGRLKKLQVLNIGSNHLSGTMPTELGNLSRLKLFHFSSNRLTGELPLQVCDLYKAGLQDSLPPLGGSGLTCPANSNCGGICN